MPDDFGAALDELKETLFDTLNKAREIDPPIRGGSSQVKFIEVPGVYVTYDSDEPASTEKTPATKRTVATTSESENKEGKEETKEHSAPLRKPLVVAFSTPVRQIKPGETKEQIQRMSHAHKVLSSVMSPGTLTYLYYDDVDGISISIKEGQDLFQVVDSEYISPGSTPPFTRKEHDEPNFTQIKSCLIQVLDALVQDFHQNKQTEGRNRVHRDLKLENIFIHEFDGNYYYTLGDLEHTAETGHQGAFFKRNSNELTDKEAKLFADVEQLKFTGLGTFAYMAPELRTDYIDGINLKAADMFALGITLAGLLYNVALQLIQKFGLEEIWKTILLLSSQDLHLKSRVEIYPLFKNRTHAITALEKELIRINHPQFKSAIELMLRLLKHEPGERLTVTQAQSAPFLTNLSEPEKQLIATVRKRPYPIISGGFILSGNIQPNNPLILYPDKIKPVVIVLQQLRELSAPAEFDPEEFKSEPGEFIFEPLQLTTKPYPHQFANEEAYIAAINHFRAQICRKIDELDAAITTALIDETDATVKPFRVGLLKQQGEWKKLRKTFEPFPNGMPPLSGFERRKFFTCVDEKGASYITQVAYDALEKHPMKEADVVAFTYCLAVSEEKFSKPYLEKLLQQPLAMQQFALDQMTSPLHAKNRDRLEKFRISHEKIVQEQMLLVLRGLPHLSPRATVPLPKIPVQREIMVYVFKNLFKVLKLKGDEQKDSKLPAEQHEKDDARILKNNILLSARTFLKTNAHHLEKLLSHPYRPILEQYLISNVRQNPEHYGREFVHTVNMLHKLKPPISLPEETQTPRIPSRQEVDILFLAKLTLTQSLYSQRLSFFSTFAKNPDEAFSLALTFSHDIEVVNIIFSTHWYRRRSFAEQISVTQLLRLAMVSERMRECIAKNDRLLAKIDADLRKTSTASTLSLLGIAGSSHAASISIAADSRVASSSLSSTSSSSAAMPSSWVSSDLSTSPALSLASGSDSRSSPELKTTILTAAALLAMIENRKKTQPSDKSKPAEVSQSKDQAASIASPVISTEHKPR